MYLFGILLWSVTTLCGITANILLTNREYHSSCLMDEHKVLCKGITTDQLTISPHILQEEKTTGMNTVIKQLEIRQGKSPIIPANAFFGLTTLRHLTIQNMSLSTIDINAFKGIDNLKFVDLSNNDLRQLPSELFKFSGLKHLKLSNNPNLIIPSDASFLFAPHLYWLSLSGCSITTLSDYSFQEMPILGHIDLSRNEIETLPANVFKNIPLVFLDLSYNKFKTLDIDTFKLIPGFPFQPRTVHLKNNPWHCNCDLNPVKVWLSRDSDTHYPTSNPQRSRLVEHTLCVSPFQNQGVSWNHLEMPQCDEENKSLTL